MKLNLLFFLFLLTTAQLFGQKYVSTIPFYEKQEIADSLRTSLRKEGIDDFYCFMTRMDVIDKLYFFWLDKDSSFILTVSDQPPLKKIPVWLFDREKPDIQSIAVLETEDDLKFKAPIEPSAECDVLIYYNKNKTYIVESGICNNFTLEESKSEARQEFFKRLKIQLKNYDL